MKLHNRKARGSLYAVLFLAAAYFGSYFIMSIQGGYGPGAVGGNGVKFYYWYPKGISFDSRRGLWIWRVYAPLWELDQSIWHRGQRN